MELDTLYEHRFPERARARKQRVWAVLWEQVFSRWVGPEDAILDLGAGYCEFINAARARRRIAVDLNPDLVKHAGAGVETHVADVGELAFLRDSELDLVFSSNFLEHLPNKETLTRTMRAVRRVLKPGGRVVLMGPNIRLVPGAYWDFYDHEVPLTDVSVRELLAVCGFDVVWSTPRFLPYTTRSLLPQWPWLVRAYLALRPLSSFLLGKQFLVVATAR